MTTTKYLIQIVRGDPVITGAYVRKHIPDPSGLRLGIAYTRDRKLARIFRDRSVAERLKTKLDARGAGTIFEIVEC